MWTHVHVVHSSACLSENTIAGCVDKSFAMHALQVGGDSVFMQFAQSI